MPLLPVSGGRALAHRSQESAEEMAIKRTRLKVHHVLCVRSYVFMCL